MRPDKLTGISDCETQLEILRFENLQGQNLFYSNAIASMFLNIPSTTTQYKSMFCRKEISYNILDELFYMFGLPNQQVYSTRKLRDLVNSYLNDCDSRTSFTKKNYSMMQVNIYCAS